MAETFHPGAPKRRYDKGMRLMFVPDRSEEESGKDVNGDAEESTDVVRVRPENFKDESVTGRVPREGRVPRHGVPRCGLRDDYRR